MHIIGNGIYSYAECADLLGVNQRRFAAWFRGWRNRSTGALLTSDYETNSSQKVVSFLDLVEAAVVLTLHEKRNVPVQTIRKLHEKLARLWRTAHPFAREELYTDDSGREIFCKIATQDGDTHLLELLRQQFAIRDFVLPFLTRVEYSEASRLAQVFTLMGRVVLDPRRKYGKPIIRGTGMPTSILHECYLATQDADQVADWYNVDVADVEDAIRFHAEFTGIAA